AMTSTPLGPRFAPFYQPAPSFARGDGRLAAAGATPGGEARRTARHRFSAGGARVYCGAFSPRQQGRPRRGRLVPPTPPPRGDGRPRRKPCHNPVGSQCQSIDTPFRACLYWSHEVLGARSRGGGSVRVLKPEDATVGASPGVGPLVRGQISRRHPSG